MWLFQNYSFNSLDYVFHYLLDWCEHCLKRERDDLIAPPCCISKSQFGLKLIQDKTFWKKEKSPRTILDQTEDQQSNRVYPSAPQWTQIKAKHLHCFITDDIFHPIKWNLKKLKTRLGVDRVKPWNWLRIIWEWCGMEWSCY